MSFHQKARLPPSARSLASKRFSVTPPLCDEVPKEGWVTSLNASPGERPSDVKVSIRSLSLRTNRRRLQGIMSRQSGVRKSAKAGRDITCTGSSRQMKPVLHSTTPRSRQGVLWQNSKKFLPRGQTVGQRAGRGKSRIWGNHEPAVSMFGAGSAIRKRAEWREYQSLTRKGQ